MDGSSAAKEGAQRHQYLSPAACASEFEPTIEREQAQRTDSSTTARAHTMRPPPSRYHYRCVRKTRIIAATLSTSHRQAQAPIASDRDWRATRRGPPTARNKTEASTRTRERLRNMYIARIDTAKSKEDLQDNKGWAEPPRGEDERRMRIRTAARESMESIAANKGCARMRKTKRIKE